IQKAVERGMFGDMRLMKPALAALEDPYKELVEVIAEKVLPMYGKAIVPDLLAKLDIKEGSPAQRHRLRLLHAVDPEGSRKVVQEVLKGGSKELRVVAIDCLGTGKWDVGKLVELTGAKAKDVRVAAMRAQLLRPA